MDTIDTISQLLHSSNSQYRLYDLSRKIDKISKEQFEKIEQNQIPYPTPSQGHACLAIVFWQKQTLQPYLWLLKLPLDERGLLNQGARNHFIAIIVAALGSDLNQDVSEKQQALLKSNPYLFTPAQYKLASLNSKIKQALKQPGSEHLAPFIGYLADDKQWQQWQTVGVQGICDFVVALNEKSNTATKHSKLLQHALPHLPKQVLLPLCAALENECLPINIIDILIALFKKQLAASNTTKETTEDVEQVQQHLLRSLASNCQHPHVTELIQWLLQQPNLTIDILITLSGRCWLALAEQSRLMAFLEQLAAKQDQALFNSIFKDLVAIPSIRPIIFQCMRSPSRSASLAAAIGQLFT